MGKYEVDTVELKKLMIENGLDTIAELSDASGVDRNTASAVLNGKKYPSSMVMSKIGTALSMTSDEMGSIFFKPKLT